MDPRVTSSSIIRHHPKRNEASQNMDPCFTMDTALPHLISPFQINLPPELTSLDSVGENNSKSKVQSYTNSTGKRSCTPHTQWNGDITSFQLLLDKVDTAIKAELKDNSNESVTLTLDDILETLEDCPTASSEDINLNFLLDEDSTVKNESQCCIKAGKQGMRGEDLNLLSPSEEQHLLCEVERAAWKVGRSLGTYLDTVTEGISNCFHLKSCSRKRRVTNRKRRVTRRKRSKASAH